MKVGFFSEVHRRSIIEATEILELSNRLLAMTGADSGQCLALAKKIPPSFRFDVRRAAAEGMTLQQIETIFSSSLLSGSWRLGLAGRDFCRAAVGSPTVNGLLTMDAQGCLTEIDTQQRET